jgi:predicted ATP-grasp superfamily ATP-dependent carboligase
MRVLVLDGNENQAVACARSLARDGHCVEVGAPSAWSKAGWSRACRASFTYPAPEQDAERFVEHIAAEVAGHPGTLVLPLTERTTHLLSAHRDTIEAAGGRMVLPPHATVLRAFDKHETTRLAASLGIATPHTELIADFAQARRVARSIAYPAVLKPRASEQLKAAGEISQAGRPRYASRREEFLAVYGEMRRRCTEVLAQEFVEGTGSGYFALLRQGELRAEFAHVRLRDVHPTGSGSCLRVSVEPDPRLRAAALAILEALNWHGVAMVEFRVRADGVPVFLEVNGRFWNSLALAVYAGVDFPALVARLAEGTDVDAPPPYQAGVRCRWLLGDFRHVLEVWRGAPNGYPGKFPGRLRTLLSFLTPVPGTFHDNLEWRDPLPELGDWLDFGLRRLPDALWRRPAAPSERHAERRYSHS